MKNTLFIFGYGYTAVHVADLFNLNEWRIIGTSSKSYSNSQSTIIPYERNKIINVIEFVTHILITIPPNENGDVVLGDFSDILPLAKNLKWIGYLSSTSVYGNHHGAVVNEESVLKPTNKRSAQRIIAETEWLEVGDKYKINVNIFRLAGIYGPTRNALNQLKSGQAKSIFKEGQVFSRIHVEDIAQAIWAAIKLENSAEIYNLADDEPCPTFEVNNFAAKLLGITPPPIIDIRDVELSEMAKEFYNDNKRVSNSKIKDKLHIKLKYPTFREGLKSMMEIYDIV